MKRNKEDFIKRLMERTNKTENECILIDAIYESHFIIGRNNQDKIIQDFMEKLNMTHEEADELYNICSELVVTGIFR